MNTKQCRRCLEVFPLTKEYFYSNGYTPNGTQKWKPTCKHCESIERKDLFDAIVSEVFPKLSCVVCRYDRCTKAIEFHHLNPKEKEFNISKMSCTRINKDNLILELKKCIPLCANCHREFHNGLLNLDNLTQ